MPTIDVDALVREALEEIERQRNEIIAALGKQHTRVIERTIAQMKKDMEKTMRDLAEIHRSIVRSTEEQFERSSARYPEVAARMKESLDDAVEASRQRTELAMRSVRTSYEASIRNLTKR